MTCRPPPCAAELLVSLSIQSSDLGLLTVACFYFKSRCDHSAEVVDPKAWNRVPHSIKLAFIHF